MNPNQDQNNQQPTASADHKKVGPIIATLIVILIVIIAALYIFAARSTTETLPMEATSTKSAIDAQLVQPVTNKADDINSLDSDLNTSAKGLDNQNF